jgi:hypothetical protein
MSGDTDDPAQALEEFLHGLHDAVELDLVPDPKASIDPGETKWARARFCSSTDRAAHV